MAPVVQLVEYSNRDTVAMLRALEARAVRGEVIGLALCFRALGGAEQCVFTGPYRHPAEAVNAAVRMKLGLAGIQRDVM